MTQSSLATPNHKISALPTDILSQIKPKTL